MAIKRITVDKSYSSILLNTSSVVLVTSEYEEKRDIITVNWCTSVSFIPRIVAVVLEVGSFSHQIIEGSGQFAINVPDISLLEQVKFCGSVSGFKQDKFIDSGLTTIPALNLDLPLINECFANIECQVDKSVMIGDHTVFFGLVISVMVEDGLFKTDGTVDLEKRKPIVHLGKDQYVTLDTIM
ncbi:flavin reductase family protein [Candidatus Omnitrophota bacterium]